MVSRQIVPVLLLVVPVLPWRRRSMRICRREALLLRLRSLRVVSLVDRAPRRFVAARPCSSPIVRPSSRLLVLLKRRRFRFQLVHRIRPLLRDRRLLRRLLRLSSHNRHCHRRRLSLPVHRRHCLLCCHNYRCNRLLSQQLLLLLLLRLRLLLLLRLLRLLRLLLLPHPLLLFLIALHRFKRERQR